MNILGFQRMRPNNSSEKEKQDSPIEVNGKDGEKLRSEKMNKELTPKEYIDKLDDFLKAVGTQPLVAKTITEQECLVDLFRFWYMDWREQQFAKEARQAEKRERMGENPWGNDDDLLS